eukprot:scaffold3892_cov255-Pinguiococcus_pyrenoidosus.AAC.6
MAGCEHALLGVEARQVIPEGVQQRGLQLDLHCVVLAGALLPAMHHPTEASLPKLLHVLEVVYRDLVVGVLELSLHHRPQLRLLEGDVHVVVDVLEDDEPDVVEDGLLDDVLVLLRGVQRLLQPGLLVGSHGPKLQDGTLHTRRDTRLRTRCQTRDEGGARAPYRLQVLLEDLQGFATPVVLRGDGLELLDVRPAKEVLVSKMLLGEVPKIALPDGIFQKLSKF